MEKHLLRAKLRMTALSLGIWVLSALIMFFCARSLWYPDFLFSYDGGLSGLQLVIPIDLILGPGLMFVVFNPTKSGTTKLVDIAVVIAVQIAALGYGLSQVYNQRPVLLSYSEGAFAPVRQEMLDRQKASVDMFSAVSSHQPPFLFVKEASPAYFPTMLSLTMNQGVGMNSQVGLLDGLKGHESNLFAGDAALRQFLKDKLPAQEQEFEQNFKPDQDKLVWFEGRFANTILVFDANDDYQGYLHLPGQQQNPVAVTMKLKKKKDPAADSAGSGSAASAATSGVAASGAGS